MYYNIIRKQLRVTIKLVKWMTTIDFNYNFMEMSMP